MAESEVTVADQIRMDLDREFDRRNTPYFEEANGRWFLRGTAGKALAWFDQIHRSVPNATRSEIEALMKCRIDMENGIHSPQYYTQQHFEQILAIIRGDKLIDA